MVSALSQQPLLFIRRNTLSENILVVTELIRGDSLEKFLKSKRDKSEWNKYENLHFGLNDRQLLTIALQIASGMRHLEERKVGDAALLIFFQFHAEIKMKLS